MLLQVPFSFRIRSVVVVVFVVFLSGRSKKEHASRKKEDKLLVLLLLMLLFPFVRNDRTCGKTSARTHGHFTDPVTPHSSQAVACLPCLASPCPQCWAATQWLLHCCGTELWRSYDTSSLVLLLSGGRQSAILLLRRRRSTLCAPLGGSIGAS